MAVSIKYCPECRTMLFSDTVQCPACKHILDQKRHEDWAAQSETRLPTVGTESACPNCGEMVRDGLVRCWKCSSFMKKEMAEEYTRMQESPQPIIYSAVVDDEIQPNPFTTDDSRANEEQDEFELGSTVSYSQPAVDEPPAQPDAAETTSGTGNGRADEDSDSASSDVAHSIATSGDVLYQTALEEERELREKRKGRKIGPRGENAFLIFCPNGHRIEVQEKFRGRTGQCPKCKAPFIVPMAEKPVESESETQDAETEPGKFAHWMTDVRIHSVSPEKLKLKAGSLKTDFQLFDLTFGEEDLLGLALSKRKGATNLTAKKRLQDRETLQEFVRSGGAIADSPAAEHFSLNAEQAKTITVVQPAAYAHESMFAGIPVFGEWRIAVRFPLGDDPASARFASFELSRFREFARILREVYGVDDLVESLDVPMENSFSEGKCHYSEQSLQFLENIEYYENDPEIALQLVGRKCQACGLLVSEDSRKKEKIGGPNGKAIAKAKCPKCQQKFGTISLFTLEAPEPQAADEAEESPSEPEAAAATKD